MAKLNYNERSWAIDVISEINDRSKKKDLMIKRAGGENTINDEEILFPDVVLFSDSSLGNILQAWELKMPDTDINNNDLIKNAFIKANKLKLSSFLVWNVNQADLYEVTDENYELLKTWNSEVNLSREDVEANQVYWKKLLYEILDDLDYLFETNQLIPRQSLDSITGEAISDILLNNFKLVSTEIKNNCSSNFILNDDVNIWWSSAKLEYGKNANKYDCLAKLVLISWINKFLFANLLKKNYKIAYNIDKIKGDVSVLEAIDIIENISNKCDFKNIFQSQLGEDCLPDSVWISLINFNNFLIDNRLEELDDDVVHSILRNTILGSKRRYYGQFPTPFNLALFLVTLVIEDKSKLVFDPCCGTGTILSAAYLLKSKFISEKESINSLWASDKFNFPLQLAMLSLTSPNHIGELIHIFNDDVIDLYEGKELSFQDPFSGEVTVEKLPKMDYILSNLPFVQQEDIKKYNPLINSKINSMIKSLTDNDDLGLDGKSDLYAYIPFSLWDLLNDGGKLGIVISNSWLGTNSGKKFYNTLHYFYEIEYVITSARGRWFEDVSVVTNILILKKRNEPLKNSNLNEKTVYVTLNEDINSDEFFENIDEICSEIRKGTLSKRFERVSYTKAEEESLLDMGLSYNALFSNVKWLFDIKDNLIKSSEICTIKRGERRGWDKLFFPVNHNIEKYYIKKVIKNSKELSGYYVDVEGSDAFCCEKSIDELKALNHHVHYLGLNNLKIS